MGRRQSQKKNVKGSRVLNAAGKVVMMNVKHAEAQVNLSTSQDVQLISIQQQLAKVGLSRLQI